MTTRKKETTCPCCDSGAESQDAVSRRHFIRTAGTAAAAATGLVALPGVAGATRPVARVLDAPAPAAPERVAEDYVKHLYESLKPEQRKAICFPFDHPLRKRVNNNWHIVPQTVGKFLDADQHELCRRILQGITTEDGYERFQKQMKDDTEGGFGDFSCALFGTPEEKNLHWVMTGRHLTLRADGNATPNAAFGGPIFYGHAVTFTEKPDHPGNVWWHQARLANQVFKSLDGKQQKKALLEKGPVDNPSSVRLSGNSRRIPGLAGSELGRDQKELLEQTLKSLLAMFRKQDVEEVIECLKKNGGLDAAHISFYQEGDLGSDGIWDRWRVEGPAFVWFFRGSPHVHTWVNIAHHGPSWV